MRDGHEHEFPALAVVGAGMYNTSEVAFDHGEDGLGLPSLAVVGALDMLEQMFHQASILAGGWLVGRSADQSQNRNYSSPIRYDAAWRNA